MKVCFVCKTAKPESEFFKCSKSKDRLQRECRDCANKRSRRARIRLRLAGKLTYSQRTQQRLKREVLCAYSSDAPQCACCGEKHIEFLAVDHINGRGGQHRREIRGQGTAFYQWLKRNCFPKGFRVLCHNCNQSFGHYGYCPHKNPERTPQPDAIEFVPPKTHCKRGHEFSPQNTVLKDGVRRCRTCMNMRHKASKERQRRALGIPQRRWRRREPEQNHPLLDLPV